MTLVKVNNRPVRAHYPSVFDKVFNSILNDADWQGGSSYTRPLANVKETEENFEIDFAIPGFSKKEVNINLEENVLTVQGKKEENANDEQWNRREFSYSEFKRSFTLPETVNQENVSASFKNGILNIMLPKKPVVKPEVKSIEIR